MKDAAVSPLGGHRPDHVMTVSGRVQFDPIERNLAQYHPVTELTGTQGMFNTVFDTVQPASTTF